MLSLFLFEIAKKMVLCTFQLGLKSILLSESTPQWSKTIVTNIVFLNYAIFNFHQANILKGFHKLYLK